MKIETFINNEAKKYKSKVLKNKEKGVDLDKLEALANKHMANCFDFIDQNISYCENYFENCKYKGTARKAIESIDDEIFGCFNDKGQCLGYNFYGR